MVAVSRRSWCRRGLVLTTIVAGLLSVVGCAQQSRQPPVSTTNSGPPQRVEVRYAQDAVQGGVQRVPVSLGSAVALVVSSDVADEVHLHGYDRSVDVHAGGTATLEFVANRSGVFEAELESRGAHLVQLEVR